METTLTAAKNSKKKLVLAAILTSGLALAISQSALAQPGQAGPGGKGIGPCYQQLDPAMEKARDKFLSETVEMRKQMAEKHAVMRAIMNAGTPDTVKAGQVAGELFELREKLRAKALEAGLPFPMMGMDCGMGDGMGMGMGAGRHNRM